LYHLISLGHDLAFESTADVFAAAAERIAALNQGVRAAELLGGMTSPEGHCVSLRGRLLLMEIECMALAEPHAFYLLGAAEDLLWHGAPLRLFLFGLYRPEAIHSYVLASMQLERERLTAPNIRSWLDGCLWPE